MFFRINLKRKSRYFLLTLILMSVICSNAAAIQDYEPFISRIIINNDSVIISPEEDLIFSSRCSSLFFELVPDEEIVYQYYLDGFDKQWTEWTKYSFKEYTNLPSGKYNFRVRYTDQQSSAGELSVLNFKVLPRWYLSRIAIISYFLLAVLIIWFSYATLRLRFARTQHMLEQIINKRTEDLIIEKDKTENLLANVLPRNTASEIMETGKATKMKYNFVTVLFSDIQGFTKIAEETNPEVLIDELDKFFFHFDSVVEKYGIEKIKTIGDAYMCAGGIPEKNRTNPVEVILAALEMQDYMGKLKETSIVAGMKFWDIRIGIHTGTVIAGVVGQKKLSYDIWGDTVNTASRMESSGEAGKINISGTTYEFVKDFFVCEYRGKMPVKYKGEIDMYFVNGIVPELRDPEGKPNKKFMLKVQLIKLQDIEELITRMFDNEAPPNLYFHNSSLVRNISNQVELLSNAEQLPEEEFITVKLASVFLFSGYISDYDNPLGASLLTVDEILPKYGFNPSTIEGVKELIRNSYDNIRRTASDNILHDARYDYLGRVDFMKLTDKLYKEESEYGKIHEKKEWFELQKKLLIDRGFITNTAKLLRSVTLEDQLASLAGAVI
jgi:adenylate cyclase